MLKQLGATSCSCSVGCDNQQVVLFCLGDSGWIVSLFLIACVMDNGTFSGGSVENQGKPWYKKWWVILIAIMISIPFFWIVLPVGLIWLVVTKSRNLDKKTRALVGASLLIFFIVAVNFASDDGKDKDSTQSVAEKTESNTDTKENQQETKPVKEEVKTVESAPQSVFDIPSLIGKSLDEVKAILGEPKTFKEPTKQQTAMVDTWEIEYEKDGVGLLVSYDLKTKNVVDFFMDGDDKAKLLSQGNLQEKSDSYVVEPVKNLVDPNKITGIKIAKKLPSELDASIEYSALALIVTNNEEYSWSNCRLEINGGFISGGYEYKEKSAIKAKSDVTIPFSEFTKDGERFNFFSQKPEKLFMACDTNGQHRSNFFGTK